MSMGRAASASTVGPMGMTGWHPRFLAQRGWWKSSAAMMMIPTMKHPPALWWNPLRKPLWRWRPCGRLSFLRFKIQSDNSQLTQMTLTTDLTCEWLGWDGLTGLTTDLWFIYLRAALNLKTADYYEIFSEAMTGADVNLPEINSWLALSFGWALRSGLLGCCRGLTRRKHLSSN